ncbi:MAG: tetratricopeptide repeat protein [Pseudomonadota bacterium]
MLKSLKTDQFLIVQLSASCNTGIGDYVYRIGQPAEAMGKLPGVMVINLTNICPFLKEICLRADILVLHLIGEQDMLPIVAERKRRGLATVYEISDNFLAFPPWVTIKRWFDDPLNLATTFQLIRLSDAIQGVSEILLDQFSFLHECRMVFENQIMELGSVQKTSKEEVTIGWAGSLGHTEDIKWMAPVIQDICQRHSNVKFAFMGNRRQYEQVFGSVANNRFIYREPGDLPDYYDFLDGLDIGLGPLIDTPYNVCRSDVKFIEYASRGVVPVVANVGPYKKHARHGENAFLFEEPESLRNVLATLITDESLRQSVKARAYDYVKNERREEAHAVERVSWYKTIAKNRASGPVDGTLFERCCEGTEAYYVKQTAAEKKIIQGAYLQSEGRLKEARAIWLDASRDLPGYYFPLFCIANSLMQEDKAKAMENIRLALAINPESLRLRLLLGETLKKEDATAAFEEFEKTLRIFPDFAPAWKEIGLLEKEQGNLEEAAKLINKALEVNPFYAVAASELGKIYLTQKKRDLAVEAFRVAANLLPENLDYQRSVIEALIEAGNFDEAVQECLDYLERYPSTGQLYGVMANIFELQGRQKEAFQAREMADKMGTAERGRQ